MALLKILSSPRTRTPSAGAARRGTTLPIFLGFTLLGSASGAADRDPQQLVADIEPLLHEHTQVLASDAYGGREPGTRFEDKTLEYLIKTFEAVGATPGNGDSWLQPVPLTALETRVTAPLTFEKGSPSDGSGGSRVGASPPIVLERGPDMVAFTRQQVPATGLDRSPLVFVGYGIVAPEYDWNDYEGIDARGKTVVMLVNDPGFATEDPELFNGRRMTWYGRWAYKYEEAARQGAAGAIIIHETEAAGYPWDTVRNSWVGTQIDLTAGNRNRDKVNVESWITLAHARALFAAAGEDFEALRSAASQRGFQARPLGELHASVSLENAIRDFESHNVLAQIPGSRYPEETIIYSSHWDHLGIHEDEAGDNIYNGAADNASGVAGLIALAKLFARGEAPERSILILAVTAEESGLLGSQWYAQNPVYPLRKTVANFNMDGIAVGALGPTRDIAVVGKGNSELEGYLARAAEAMNRVVVEEPYPEKGMYYRSDHFSFARVGVPALFLIQGTDSLAHGNEYGRRKLTAYLEEHYHQPSDEYAEDWDLGRAAEEVALLYMMGRELAGNRDFPKWHDGVEFKAIREESRPPAGG